jgi:hypothetical protein
MHRTDPDDDPVITDVTSLRLQLEPVHRTVGDALVVHLDRQHRFTCLAAAPTSRLDDLLDDEPFLLAAAHGCGARSGYLVLVDRAPRSPRPAEVAVFDQLAAAHAEIGVALHELVVVGPSRSCPEPGGS